MKNNHKIFKGLIAFVILLSSTNVIYADSKKDFKKNEAYYTKLCASSTLTTKKQETCKDFLSYLKEKNRSLKSEAAKQKSEINSTQSSISSLKKKIATINQQIEKQNNEYKRTINTINSLDKTIKRNRERLNERLYVMQGSYNSNMWLNYILSAESFKDFFTKVSCLREIINNDTQEIESLELQEEQLKTQKKLLETQKKTLKSKKAELSTLEEELNNKLSNQNSEYKETNSEIAETTADQKKLDENLKRIFEEAKKEKIARQKKIDEEKAKKEAKRKAEEAKKKAEEAKKKAEEAQKKADEADNEEDKKKAEEEKKKAEEDKKKAEQEEQDAIKDESSTSLGVKVANIALGKQGCRYWYGKAGPDYFDCSGLVYYAFKQAGCNISRTSSAGCATSSKFKNVSYNDLKIGDIITFNYGSGVQHVGIYIGNGNMVNALGVGSSTKGQYADQCVKINSVKPGSHFYKYIYNCRRWKG